MYAVPLVTSEWDGSLIGSCAKHGVQESVRGTLTVDGGRRRTQHLRVMIRVTTSQRKYRLWLSGIVESSTGMTWLPVMLDFLRAGRAGLHACLLVSGPNRLRNPIAPPFSELPSSAACLYTQSVEVQRVGAAVPCAHTSVPLPTFASHCSTLGCERWKQRDTSKLMVLVRFWL
jgi:hypothetical protein